MQHFIFVIMSRCVYVNNDVVLDVGNDGCDDDEDDFWLVSMVF